jgi:hypothetical protein
MSESELAIAVSSLLSESRWAGAALARALMLLSGGGTEEDAARILYASGCYTLTKSRTLVPRLKQEGFVALIDERTRMGSAENPVTKLFPGAVTERHFLACLDELTAACPGLSYSDARFSGHTLVDFTLHQGDISLPVNVKNAGTRFENAGSLVGLEPDDCIPIPAYKAHQAIEVQPNLIYLFAIDYRLTTKIETHLLTHLNAQEAAVWKLLNAKSGSRIRDAEDTFIYAMEEKYWPLFTAECPLPGFRAISARRAIRILQTLPNRTPGIGLRAWGTGASAEVNVHISIHSETKPWDELHQRIFQGGLDDLIGAINHKRTEVVFDPEL